MKPRDLLALITLGALWGASFLFIRVAAPTLGPFALVELRVGIAGTVLLLYAAVASRVPEIWRRWKGFLILGTLNAAVPYSLIASAEVNLTASLGAILNSTTALFTALVASVWIGEALTKGKLLGLLLGFGGVAVLVGWHPVPLSGVVLLSGGAVLAGSLSYAVATVYAKRAFAGEKPLAMAVGQQAGAEIVLLPFAAATVPREAPPLSVGLSALALALLCTAVAYLLYFRLVATVGPTATSTVTFLVPAFGVLFGVLFLGEPLGAGTLAGLGTILLGVALATGVRPAPPEKPGLPVRTLRGRRDAEGAEGRPPGLPGRIERPATLRQEEAPLHGRGV
jgi:drug/metabolite transporter (DMT)-like permease